MKTTSISAVFVLIGAISSSAGCGRTADCRANTVLVKASCGAALSGARVDVSLATKAGRQTEVLTMRPCPTSQLLEFALEGYDALTDLSVRGQAFGDGNELRSSVAFEVDLGASCTSTAINLDDGLTDGGGVQDRSDAATGPADASPSDVETPFVPQCAGLQAGALFCLGSDVRRCEEGLKTSSLVTSCKAPTPSCMQGACGACVQGDSRSCDEGGLLGACKAGVQRCNSNGTWGGCSISPLANDTCQMGDDSNCNGVVNDSPNCACVNGTTGTCAAKLGAKGTCAGGTTTCVNGNWSTCSVTPAAVDDCVFGNDDNCDGTPSGSTDSASCQCLAFIIPNPDIAPAVPFSYKDNGDGTILDNVTQLTWEKDASAACAVDGCNFAQAALYCSSKGIDWRLPTIAELVTLVDFSIKVPGPTINQSFFPNTKGALYWSSSPYKGEANVARYVSFFAGAVSATLSTDKGWVRCVRR